MKNTKSFFEEFFPEFLGAYIVLMLMMIAVMMVFQCGIANGEEISCDKAVQCILGEARGEYSKHGDKAFLAVAEALRNRGTTKGVYGCTAKFTKEIPYLKAKRYYKAAEQAWIKSKTSHLVGGAKNWESSDFKKPYWAKNMKVAYRVGKHIFYR